MNTYQVTYQDGQTEILKTKKELTGVVGFKNKEFFGDEWGHCITSSKNPRKFYEDQKNISGRDWLTEWHMAEFEKIEE